MLLVASLVLLPSLMAASDQEQSDALGACRVEEHNCNSYDHFWDPVLKSLRETVDRPLCFSCPLGEAAQKIVLTDSVEGYRGYTRVSLSLSYYYAEGRKTVKPTSVTEGLRMSEEAISKVKKDPQVSVVGCGKNEVDNQTIHVECLFSS